MLTVPEEVAAAASDSAAMAEPPKPNPYVANERELLLRLHRSLTNLQTQAPSSFDCEELQQVVQPVQSWKKELLKRIRDQMHFYFGDAALLKDRFLKQEIERSSGGCTVCVNCRNMLTRFARDSFNTFC